MQRPMLKLVAGALLLIAGLACLGFALASLGKDASLWVFGRRTMAEIVDAWAEPISDEGASQLAFQYFVRYRFVTEEGKVITRTSPVGQSEWAGLGTLGRGRAGVDDFDGQPLQTAAPVYQEQKHVPQEGVGGMEVGNDVPVLYFPPYPEHNRLDDSRYVPLLACTYVPLLCVAAVALVVGRELVRSAWAPASEGWRF